MIADAQPIRFLPPIDKSDKSSIDRRISRTDSVNSRDAKNMSTSDNFEKILTEIENEIDQIQIKFKNDENKIMHSIMRLTGEAEQAGVLVDQIDSQLGGFYGSMELRDALKEAESQMQAVLAVLQRVREYVRSPFVRLEIEHLQHNIFTLQKVFIRMFKRMEIPDSDDFFNEALSTNSTSDIRRASKEPRNA
ncbi:hypothetical protein Q1695_010402 [Nippostrongylus brasiliensis]|nr:hypothetical protein Q1695_010402 [Nippostrongylus brasiliensis]